MPLFYIEKVLAANSVEQVWKLLCDRMESYGFDRLLYGFTRNMTESGVGVPDELLILSNHSPEYTQKFIESGMYFGAPMLRWALTHTGAQSWSWLSENTDKLTATERDIIAFNRSMGVTAGYTISFQDNKIRNKAGLGLCARDGMSQKEVDELWKKVGHEILVMAQVTHLVLTTLPYTPAGRSLTKRQKEVLEWVGDGKTMQDISTIMGVSPATIEKHLRLAREALDVETTAQAVVKASFQNQIYAVNV